VELHRKGNAVLVDAGSSANVRGQFTGPQKDLADRGKQENAPGRSRTERNAGRGPLIEDATDILETVDSQPGDVKLAHRTSPWSLLSKEY
jgi:hypothetical protein